MNVPVDVLQTLKKQCNPLLKKTFKERNPDVDMDEIQNNPNVPEDVKAAITGALSLAVEEEEEPDEAELSDDMPPPIEDLETFDDDYIMDMSEDDGKKRRRRRVDENDEDWLTGRRKPRPRRNKRKHKKKSKNSENGENSKESGDKQNAKKKRSRKTNAQDDTLDTSLNSTLVTTLNSTMSSTLDSTNTSFGGGEVNNGGEMLNGYENERKENKLKKTPKKRDSTEKPVNGIVKKTSRRQFTSISAIMACIESVVQGSDVSMPESSSEITVKSEPTATEDLFKSPESMRPIKSERVKVEANGSASTEPKKPRRSSTKEKKPKPPKPDKLDQSLLNQSAINVPNKTKKFLLNGSSVKEPRTSRKKAKLLS